MTYADAIIAAATAITVAISASLMMYHTNETEPPQAVAGSAADDEKHDKLDAIERKLDDAVSRQKEIIARIERINATRDAMKMKKAESGKAKDED